MIVKDEDLVYGLKIRDPGISELFFSRYGPMVFRLAMSVLGDEILASDCAQDVLFKVLRSIQGFQGRSTLKTWIISITLNTARTRLKREIKRNRRSRSLEDIDLSSPAEGPEQYALRMERSDKVVRALRDLRPEYREILVLRETEELSYEEIAEILSIPIGTVRSRLARARLALAEQFRKEFRNHEL
ncbi:MAG TPA: RNA polymerase sigma factor [Thermoanaerobaculia bacterium]|nr:RNA polymerase sigma factor [Thermoanaerobaculia bacterium]HUM29324.1 RNA polymerase sigma factor [Thermoanaerobaculia bacterium]HXK67718.1 RNA polymerase sigma factor [Thermoanaerobaculia bacterium]